ncbi:hypothetical protein [Haloarchaeobius litoreus]|uniref:DUF2795 domain-containing protein n=1 Tax=Haloarchaeobius litoreus TaxID=755306 RepID=A0ABD6DMG7_9EURY|nr:hypothetical protein [Haloarchaeobius litoreus]
MARKIKLNELDGLLTDFDYPVDPDEVAADCEDVTLQLADGEANLAETVAGSDADTFASVDELRSEVLSLLPRRSVGEPFQSEGEG